MPAGECTLRALRERSSAAEEQNALSLIRIPGMYLRRNSQHNGSIGVSGEKCKRKKLEKWVSLNLSFVNLSFGVLKSVFYLPSRFTSDSAHAKAAGNSVIFRVVSPGCRTPRFFPEISWIPHAHIHRTKRLSSDLSDVTRVGSNALFLRLANTHAACVRTIGFL